MKKAVLALFVVAILLIVLRAWDPLSLVRAPRCELLAGPGEVLRTLDYDGVEEATFPEWVASTYQVDRADIGSDRPADEPIFRTVRWNARGAIFAAGFDYGSLQQITMRWKSSLFNTDVPRAQEVIDCFDPPPYYRATYFYMGQRNELHVELWYPDEGTIARILRAASVTQDQPPEVTSRTPISSISYTRWREVSELEQVGTGFRRNSLDAYPLKPWPGSFEAIEIEIDPAILDD